MASRSVGSSSSADALPPAPASSSHTGLTRLFHAALAIAIIVQLASSQFMSTPLRGRDANTAFVVHQYSGLTALALVLGFWVVVLTRRRGTRLSTLFPWYSSDGRSAVLEDIRHLIDAGRSRRWPLAEKTAALGSAIHGLGLLLMTGMASTGALIYVALIVEAARSSWSGLVTETHEFLAGLVWTYLIGHAGMALLHHFRHEISLATMWRR